MNYDGQLISVTLDKAHHTRQIATVRFESKTQFNVINTVFIDELAHVLDLIEQQERCDGVIFCSAHPNFILGADVKELHALMTRSNSELIEWLTASNQVLNRIEQLPIPTVAAIRGFTLGGGLELAMMCDYRIASHGTTLGLPEIDLGIMPGFGGTARLPRLIGPDKALTMLLNGHQHSATMAQSMSLVDGVVAEDILLQQGDALLDDAIMGRLNWQNKRQQKCVGMAFSNIELEMLVLQNTDLYQSLFEHNPASKYILNSVIDGMQHPLSDALDLEARCFSKVISTDVAPAKMGAFLAEKQINKKLNALAKGQAELAQVGIVGAGIMGGGIAITTAMNAKTPVVIQDISKDALGLGEKEMTDWLEKQHKRGRIKLNDLVAVRQRASFSQQAEALANTDLIVEAVIEKLEIKQSVLGQLESIVSTDTVLATNTSTLTIDSISAKLARPENFCGMHYFNPVPQMKLVEIIRGEKTSQETISKATALALRQGKTPLIVKDCPGFYVNRVLFPYLIGFSQLVKQGVDFKRIDNVMSEFGWPMGPARLSDVIGIDTLNHCLDVMSKGYPSRMTRLADDPYQVLYQAQRFGDKTSQGFYDLVVDKRGRNQPVAQTSYEYLPIKQDISAAMSDQEICERLMFPMINEVARCLEEGIVDTQQDADIGLLYALGFPRFRGGPFTYLNSLGVNNFVERCKYYQQFGELFSPPKLLQKLALQNQSISSYGGNNND
jgi:3-hydroxyacyl-CoA dehydrogenase/enoyl-CoA hydratase/3-hydroxybutyryl-CoA epimerase/enoyl-CoA isomerase